MFSVTEQLKAGSRQDRGKLNGGDGEERTGFPVLSDTNARR